MSILNKNCLDTELLIRYVEGQTDKVETRRVEWHISECSLCGEAVEGLMKVKEKGIIQEDLKIINQKWEKQFPIKTQAASFQLWQIAAAACILAVLGISFFFFFQKNDLSKKEVAESQTQLLDTIAPIAEAPAFQAHDSLSQVNNKDEKKSVVGKASASETPSLIVDKTVAKENKLTEEEMPKPIEKQENVAIVDDARILEKPSKAIQASPKIMPKPTTTSTTKSTSLPSYANNQNYNIPPQTETKNAGTTKGGGTNADVNMAKPKKEAEIASKPSIVPSKDYPSVASAPPAPATSAGSYQKEDQAMEDDQSSNNSSVNTTTVEAGKIEKKGQSPLQKGKSLMKKKRYTEAIEILSQLSSDDPHYEDAQLEIANCYLKLNQKANAETVLSGIVSRNRKNVDNAKKMMKSAK